MDTDKERKNTIKNSNSKNYCEVVYEDSSFLVINKPRGIHTVSLKNKPEEASTPTVADFLCKYLPENELFLSNPLNAGLIQRLDFFTSGLLLAAKDRQTFHLLQNTLQNKQIEKSYLALCENSNKKAKLGDILLITTPLKYRKNSNKVFLVQDLAKKVKKSEQIYQDCKTQIKILKLFSHQGSEYLLVEASASLARRHQIRLHLASIGMPLIGDIDYGAESSLDNFKDIFSEELTGFLLHANSLKLPEAVFKTALQSNETLPKSIQKNFYAPSYYIEKLLNYES